MGDIGFPELIVILLIALLIFGPGRVPDMGRSLGRALREFRDAIRGEPSAAEEAPGRPAGLSENAASPPHPDRRP